MSLYGHTAVLPRKVQIFKMVRYACAKRVSIRFWPIFFFTSFSVLNTKPMPTLQAEVSCVWGPQLADGDRVVGSSFTYTKPAHGN